MSRNPKADPLTPTFSGAHVNEHDERRDCRRAAARQVRDGKQSMDDLRTVLAALNLEEL